MSRALTAVAGVIAILAIVASFAAAGIALSDRGDSVAVTCRQVKQLRSDLVAVLESARDASKQRTRGLKPPEARELRARIDAFYAPQIARVGPVHCP